MSYATPKSERYSLSEGAIDKLAAKAKENPDLSRGEFGKGELVSALDDLTDMLNDKRIDTQSRGSLGRDCPQGHRPPPAGRSHGGGSAPPSAPPTWRLPRAPRCT
jgi:hypothetical protein